MGSESRKQRVYLAGPMRGYVEYNFPAFHAAAAKLRAHGLEVWSPAENDVNQDGFDPAKDTAQPMIHYMRRDLPAVLASDFVAVLPGWEKSQGACLEVHVARTCGLPVYHADTLQAVAVPSERKDTTLPDEVGILYTPEGVYVDTGLRDEKMPGTIALPVKKDQAVAILKTNKDAARFDYLQNAPVVEAQAFFWNYASRKQRAEAIDEAIAINRQGVEK